MGVSNVSCMRIAFAPLFDGVPSLLLAGLRKDCANLFSNLAAGNAHMCVWV